MVVRLLEASVMLVATVPFSMLLLKAKGWLFLVSLCLPIGGIGLAVAGAARLAKPGSWWARHLYRDAELNRSRMRYGVVSVQPETTLAALGWTIMGLVAALAVLYVLGFVQP
jgi:hypothetical protein